MAKPGEQWFNEVIKSSGESTFGICMRCFPVTITGCPGNAQSGNLRLHWLEWNSIINTSRNITWWKMKGYTKDTKWSANKASEESIWPRGEDLKFIINIVTWKVIVSTYPLHIFMHILISGKRNLTFNTVDYTHTYIAIYMYAIHSITYTYIIIHIYHMCKCVCMY